jgi:3-phenylpropionate/trans-cinnamate dioxygenase ferredoxin reductase subunit
MSNTCRVSVNGGVFSARRGDLLLDAALTNGVDIPHDCRSGHCGTCRVHVIAGRYIGGDTGDPDMVQACLCRIVSDMEISVEEVPEVVTRAGRVDELIRVAPDVFEVRIEPSSPIHYIPGQYYRVQFRGFPARCYSPTAPLDWPCNDRAVHFHIRRFEEGRVSSALGRTIHEGHRVRLIGPLGSAFLRPFASERLVLVASGTGFAPMWAIAEAAIKEQPLREIVLVVGAREIESMYMIPALCRLALFPNVLIVPVVLQPQRVTAVVREGRPTDYLPALSLRDVVYAAGAPAMVEAVTQIARAAGARCYADPFEPEANRSEGEGLLSRVVEWLGGDLRLSPPLSMDAPTDEWPAASDDGDARAHAFLAAQRDRRHEPA